MSLVVVLVCFIGINFTAGLEYKVNYERLELAYYDKSLVANEYFLFRKFNRTNYCLNVSMDLLEDLDGNQIQCTTSVHQFLNNEYKSTGIAYSFNVCELYSLNLFGIKSQLAKYGNLEACDLKKGHYYMYNFMPDESYFPKYLPPGKFMVQMEVVRKNGGPLLTFQWYILAELKIQDRIYKG